jgi:hypothetical protein
MTAPEAQTGKGKANGWLSLPAALLFCGSVLMTTWLLDRLSPGSGLRLAVLLMPAPLFVLFAVAALRSFAACDERQRGLLIEALTFGFILTLFALIAAELLELARVPVWRNEDAWPYVVFAGYIGGYWSAVKRTPS